MANEGNFSDRYRKAVQDEEMRKQQQRDGESGELQAEYRRMIDETSPTTKIASFIFWGAILYVLYWIIS
jgi:hypothetical protein